MAVFYFLFIFLLLGAFITPKFQRPYIFLSFSLLLIIAGFRDVSVGTDTVGYEEMFLRLKRGATVPQEVGWESLNKIILYFGGHFKDLLFISSLLTLAPAFYVFLKYSNNPMLSAFLYYAFYIYIQSFNITRQILAVSIILCAYVCLVKSKKLLFLILVLLASTFHTTALLCLPLFFVDKIPDKVPMYIIIMGLTVVFGWVLSDYVINQAAIILGYGHYLLGVDLSGGVGVYLITLNFFFLFVLFTAKNRGLLFKLFFVFVILANLFAKVPYAYRLIFYFTVIQVLYLPYFISNNKLRTKPLVFIVIVLYATLLFYRSSGSGGIIPYINTLF